MSVERSVIVVGAGITGLACALHLQRLGIPVKVLEASDSPGGMIATFERNGFLIETGPQYPRFARPLWDLARDVGLDSEFVRGSSSAQRFILKNGRLHQAPLSPGSFLSTQLIGPSSKYRILTEAVRRSRPPADEESLSEFVRRKFDDEVLQYLVDPFVSAIYAGDTEKIGVESAFPFLSRWERERGSILRGAIQSRKSRTTSRSNASRASDGKNRTAVTDFLPRMGSFRTGLAALPNAIAAKLGGSISFRAKAESIEPTATTGNSDRGWLVRLNDGEELSGSAVVVAAPAYEAARLLQRIAPKISEMLAGVTYAPMAVVASGYTRAQVRNSLHGFGLMIPRREALNTFFNVWNSSMFSGRAPEGKVLMTSFAGGATNPAIVEHEETAIAQVVERELAEILGIDGPPVERFVWKHQKALPQFNVGHARRTRSIRQAQAALPGLYLAGNYLQGRSLGECAELGSQTADEIQRRFRG